MARIELSKPVFASHAIYGPGIGGDSLANTHVGSKEGSRKSAIRFRAEQSNAIESVIIAYVGPDYPRYGAGTGGRKRVSIFADDGTPWHFPKASAPLASVDLEASTKSEYLLVHFPKPALTMIGRWYHVVIETIDADSDANYFSVNAWARLEFEDNGPLNPRWPDADWSQTYFHDGRWHERKGACPIAQVNYANGKHQGCAYIEASYWLTTSTPEERERMVGVIDGETMMVRERFTVSDRDRYVMGGGMRVLREIGTTAELIASLHDEGGKEIVAVSMAAGNFAEGRAPVPQPTSGDVTNDDGGAKAKWCRFSFVPHCVIRAGSTYEIRFRSRGKYWIWPERDGRWYGFGSSTHFADGFAEYTRNGGKTWSGAGRVQKENHWPWYLRTESVR